MAELTARQRAFVDHFLATFNASEAARRIGVTSKRAARRGYELRENPAVAAEIKARLDALTMTADEVLIRLAQHARASLDSFVADDAETPAIDIGKARAAGAMHLAKRIKTTVRRKRPGAAELVSVEVEIVDTQAALVALGRAHSLFTDRLRVVDWRDEARAAGLSDERIEQIFNGIVEQVAQHGTKNTEQESAGDGE